MKVISKSISNNSLGHATLELEHPQNRLRADDKPWQEVQGCTNGKA